MGDTKMDEREYWRMIVQGWNDLEAVLPQKTGEERDEIRRLMKELAEELPKKFRALL